MTKLVLPTPEQVEWADCELGVIIHLDLPVFSGENYDFRKHFGDPLPASIFAPDALDTDQWARAAAGMGAKYAVLVAKHCTGFCLWPTKAHGYSVASSPWKDGQGDVVREFVDACRKYDVLPGLYYSVSCNQYMNVDNPGLMRDRDPEKQRAYNEMALEQLTELWTNYGELFEIWFDGGCLPPEEGGPDVAALLSHLQPNAVVFQGPRGLPSRLRWVGNERGVADENCSSIMNEGAELLDCDPCRLDQAASDGVIAINLTWNHANALSGSAKERPEQGLTPLGRRFMSRMEELHILVDVSHLSEAGFWDVIGQAKKPVLASHSNAKSVWNHTRNLTDEQITAIIKNQGVIGLNFYQEFVGLGRDLDAVRAHLDHILSLGGANCVALGGDWDGCDTIDALPKITDLQRLYEYLLYRNYDETVLGGLFYNNLMRVVRQK